MVPVYIVSREKEKARERPVCVCAHQKFLGVPISRRRSSLLRDNSHDYGAEACGRCPGNFFPVIYLLLNYAKMN